MWGCFWLQCCINRIISGIVFCTHGWWLMLKNVCDSSETNCSSFKSFSSSSKSPAESSYRVKGTLFKVLKLSLSVEVLSIATTEFSPKIIVIIKMYSLSLHKWCWKFQEPWSCLLPLCNLYDLITWYRLKRLNVQLTWLIYFSIKTIKRYAKIRRFLWNLIMYCFDTCDLSYHQIILIQHTISMLAFTLIGNMYELKSSLMSKFSYTVCRNKLKGCWWSDHCTIKNTDLNCYCCCLCHILNKGTSTDQ